MDDISKINCLLYSSAPWNVGWVSFRMTLSEGWKSCWLVLRSFTIAVYASPKEPWSRPLGLILTLISDQLLLLPMLIDICQDYWKFADIKSVQAVGYDAFKRSFAFQIITSRLYFDFTDEKVLSNDTFSASDMVKFSVECSDQPDWDNIVANAPPNWLNNLLNEWVGHFESLLFLNRVLTTRFQPPHMAHPHA